jgi:hypothetical protein
MSVNSKVLVDTISTFFRLGRFSSMYKLFWCRALSFVALSLHAQLSVADMVLNLRLFSRQTHATTTAYEQRVGWPRRWKWNWVVLYDWASHRVRLIVWTELLTHTHLEAQNSVESGQQLHQCLSWWVLVPISAKVNNLSLFLSFFSKKK